MYADSKSFITGFRNNIKNEEKAVGIALKNLIFKCKKEPGSDPALFIKKVD